MINEYVVDSNSLLYIVDRMQFSYTTKCALINFVFKSLSMPDLWRLHGKTNFQLQFMIIDRSLHPFHTQKDYELDELESPKRKTLVIGILRSNKQMEMKMSGTQ